MVNSILLLNSITKDLNYCTCLFTTIFSNTYANCCYHEQENGRPWVPQKFQEMQGEVRKCIQISQENQGWPSIESGWKEL